MEVESLASHFTYTKQNIRFEKLDFKTKYSNFNGDVILNYDRKDFADFNNKVVLDIYSNSALISSTDIKYFWKEMGKEQEFKFSGKVDGTLNDFFAQNLKLTDNHSIIEGDVRFKNLFAKPKQGDFYMKGSFKKVSSSYEKVTSLLPNVLGKKLPNILIGVLIQCAVTQVDCCLIFCPSIRPMSFQSTFSHCSFVIVEQLARIKVAKSKNHVIAKDAFLQCRKIRPPIKRACKTLRTCLETKKPSVGTLKAFFLNLKSLMEISAD